jgi:hypothetical protein
VVITSVGDPELLLRYIDTLVQVQVGPVLSSNNAEVETKVLRRVRVCGDLDLGGSPGVGESLQVGELIGRGHTVGAIEKEPRRGDPSAKETEMVKVIPAPTHIAIRPKLVKSASMTVRHPDTPLLDQRICCPSVEAGGGVVPEPPKATIFQTWSTPPLPHACVVKAPSGPYDKHAFPPVTAMWLSAISVYAGQYLAISNG